MSKGKVVQSEKRELASLSRGKIRPGDKDEWINEHLYIPPLPPTNLRGCHLIKINYDVYVSILTSVSKHDVRKLLSRFVGVCYFISSYILKPHVGRLMYDE